MCVPERRGQKYSLITNACSVQQQLGVLRRHIASGLPPPKSLRARCVQALHLTCARHYSLLVGKAPRVVRRTASGSWASLSGTCASCWTRSKVPHKSCAKYKDQENPTSNMIRLRTGRSRYDVGSSATAKAKAAEKRTNQNLEPLWKRRKNLFELDMETDILATDPTCARHPSYARTCQQTHAPPVMSLSCDLASVRVPACHTRGRIFQYCWRLESFAFDDAICRTSGRFSRVSTHIHEVSNKLQIHAVGTYPSTEFTRRAPRQLTAEAPVAATEFLDRTPCLCTQRGLPRMRPRSPRFLRTVPRIRHQR